MRNLREWMSWIFLALWVFALALMLIGTFGLFGQETDPLSAVFLMPLGLPWNLFTDLAPELAWPWLAAIAPGINLILMRGVCAKLAARGAMH